MSKVKNGRKRKRRIGRNGKRKKKRINKNGRQNCRLKIFGTCIDTFYREIKKFF
ncbi:MAG: hypothetical protein V3U54_11660 [Thermodesulfobacteriota bacterium]